MAELDSLLGIFRQSADNRRVKRCLVGTWINSLFIYTEALQPSMILLRDKAFTILSLHHGGQHIKPRIDAHVEQLLGGSPVVLKKSETVCKPQPFATAEVSRKLLRSTIQPLLTPELQKPQRSDNDMQFDLQALLGSGGSPINPGVNVEPVVNQPLSSTWNTALPNENQLLNGIEGFDTILMNYLSEQPGGLNTNANPNWDDFIRAMT